MISTKIYFLTSASKKEIINAMFPKIAFVSCEKFSDEQDTDDKSVKRICPDDLFFLFTAEIIAKRKVFAR